jgi:hypothetical protein
VVFCTIRGQRGERERQTLDRAEGDLHLPSALLSFNSFLRAFQLPMVIPDDGLNFLAGLHAAGLPLAPTIGLFTGPLVPNSATTLLDIQEATFNGYVRKPVPLPWDVPTASEGALEISAADDVIWTSAGSPGDLLTGYFLVQLDALLNLRLVALERFGSTVKIGIDVAEVAVLVEFQYTSEF